MKARKLFSLIVSLAVVFPAVLSAQPAVQLTTLVSFGGTNGSGPLAPLFLAKDGNFYGTTANGGSYADQYHYGYGTIFRMTPDGTLTTLAMFDGENGWSPYAGLVQDTQGNFYGTTLNGGTNSFVDQDAGNIIELTTNGTLISLYSFDYTNGAWPSTTLQTGADGNLYGIAQLGGVYPGLKGYGWGTFFRITPGGVFSKLLDFDGTNGTGGFADLTLGSDGNFYYAGGGGGTNGGFGTIFKLSTNGVSTLLFSLNGTNGAAPNGGLLFDRNGSIYGTTELGGTNTLQGSVGTSGYTNSVFGYGTVFRLDPDGTFTNLVYFNGTNGAYPRGRLLPGRDGVFYGITSGSPGAGGMGTIFQMAPDGTLKTLITFNGTNGSYPYAGLICGADGNLYGTTHGGGAYGDGTIYRLTVPMTPVLQPVFSNSGQFVFSWNSAAGLNYQVQYNADAGSTNWANVGSLITASSGTTFQTNALTGAQGFYRVLLVQ